MRIKNHKKSLILGRLAKSLTTFYPTLDGHFMCPTCITAFPASERSRITEAHIVPRAAGGSLKTYVCKDCNDKFGSNQDRWLGEYLQLRRRMHAKEDVTILDAPTKPGHFMIDGTRVQGTFGTEPSGAIGFYIYTDQTSPEALRRVLSNPPKTITAPVPLLSRQDLVDVGFLTAAYLLWFKEFGYSWGLQAHLDQVRQQIQAPTSRIIDARYWITCPGTFVDRPWVGVAFIRNEAVLVAALADRLIILPPADRKNVYSILDEEFEGLTSRYHQMHFLMAIALVLLWD